MAKKTVKNRVVKDLTGIYDLGAKLTTLADGHYHIQIGIFGNKDGREKGGVTNAEIGFIHEMGAKSGKIPRRSFLWLTFDRKGPVLEIMFKDIMKGILDPTIAKSGQSRDEGKIKAGLKKVGMAAENLVQMAFQTGGFGWWAPLQPGTIAAKGSGKPLIDTGQLRRSIASRVRK